MKSKWITLVLIGATLEFGGCKRLFSSFQQPSSPVVARVGDVEITAEQVQDEFDAQRLGFQGFLNHDQVCKVLIERLIERSLLTKAALAERIDREPAVRRRMENDRLKFLASTFRTRLVERHWPDIQKDSRRYYSMHPDEYRPKIMFQLSQILVNTPAAKDHVMRLLKKGTPFADVARDFSIDLPTKQMGGRMPLRPSTEPASAFETKLRRMKVGEVGVEELPGGMYQIYRKDDMVKRSQVEFKDVETMLNSRESANVAKAWLDKERHRTSVQIDQQALNLIYFSTATASSLPSVPQPAF